MIPKGKKPPQRIPSSVGAGYDFAEVAREFESRAANDRLSDDERDAVPQGIDAVQVGSFAPEEEMDEFYRLHHAAQR